MTFAARISINGTPLTDHQVMIVQLAIDALASLFKDRAAGTGGIPFTADHLTALTQVQALFGGKPNPSAVH